MAEPVNVLVGDLKASLSGSLPEDVTDCEVLETTAGASRT
jgi:hypothetical protein